MTDLVNTAFRDSESVHWYTQDGEPMHTIVGANGRERATNLRDAKKLRLLPSVTSILSCLANLALAAWKQRQVLMSALTLPRNPLETAEQFAVRVIDDSKRQAKEAAEWGNEFHGIAQIINNGGIIKSMPIRWLSWEAAYREWYDSNIAGTIAAEKVLVDVEAGFAGTCDLIAEHRELGLVLVDYKRQDVKKGKASFYSKWLYQLAAYRHAYKSGGRCISLVVDCNEPKLYAKVWDDKDVERGWEVFRALIKVWQAEKGYQPCG